MWLRIKLIGPMFVCFSHAEMDRLRLDLSTAVDAEIIIPAEFLSNASPAKGLRGRQNISNETFTPKTDHQMLATDIIARLTQLIPAEMSPGPDAIAGFATTASKWSNIATEGWVHGANLLNAANHRLLNRLVDVSFVDKNGQRSADTDIQVVQRMVVANIRWIEFFGDMNDRLMRAGAKIAGLAADQLVELSGSNSELPDLVVQILTDIS